MSIEALLWTISVAIIMFGLGFEYGRTTKKL